MKERIKIKLLKCRQGGEWKKSLYTDVQKASPERKLG